MHWGEKSYTRSCWSGPEQRQKGINIGLIRLKMINKTWTENLTGVCLHYGILLGRISKCQMRKHVLEYVLINGSWFEIVCSTLNVVDYDL